MRIIVIGGGIGGVTTAVALRAEGFDPLVLEQAAAITEVGAGVTLGPHSAKILRKLGAGDAFSDAVALQENTTRDLHTNEVLEHWPMGNAISDRYGESLWAVHRADVIDSLLKLLPDSALRTGARVTGVEQRGDEAVVLLEDGEALSADVVIAADGVHSTVRAGMGVDQASFTGRVVWRATFLRSKVPGLRSGANARLWTGPGRHITFYSIRRLPDGDELMNFVGHVPAAELRRESWALSGDVDELRASFAGACDEALEVIDAIDEAFVTGLYFRFPLSSWGSGRMTLLGDAAHPVLPPIGQGVSMAVEDAVTVATCLRRCADDPDGALREFQLHRQARTAKVQITSLHHLRTFNESDAGQIAARNGRLRGLATLQPWGQQRWLFEHDAAAEAEIPYEQQPAAVRAAGPLRRPEARRAYALWRQALTIEDGAEGWIGQRAAFERFLLDNFPPAADTPVQEISCDGVRALLVGAGKGPIALHLHGGAFVFGGADAAVELASRLARAADRRILVPDYRLAPEHNHGAVLADVLRVCRWLGNAQEQPIVISGECAGGGLAASAAHALIATGEQPPAALFLVSPLADLGLTAASIDDNGPLDPWLDREMLTDLVASALQDADPRDPLVSPVHGAFAGVPEMVILAAEQEALVDDARALARAAEAAGVDVSLTLEPDSVHSFILFDFLDESRRAIDAWTQLVARAS